VCLGLEPGPGSAEGLCGYSEKFGFVPEEEFQARERPD
jgi:hypothetical protein